MRSMFRPAAALAAVLLASVTASAGPIPWGFQIFDSSSGLDRVAIELSGLGVGEYRELALTRPVLDPNPVLPNPRTHWSDQYSVYTSVSRKVRVWMGTDDVDHDQWRVVSWSVSREYYRTANSSAWVAGGERDFLHPTEERVWRPSVVEFENGDPGDGLVNRVELWNESGTAVFRMTPDLAPDVPEPATLALAAVGLGAVGLRRALRVDRTRRAG